MSNQNKRGLFAHRMGGVRGSLMETKVSPGTMARKLQSK